MFFLKSFLMMLVVVFFMIFMAIMHENDIARSCRKYGTSGLSGWVIDFKCSEMKETSK